MRWILAAFWFTGSAFGAGWFSYELAGVPANSQGCAVTAKALADRFARDTNTKIFRGSCSRDRGAAYDVTVDYRTDERAFVVSTAYETGGPGALGLYRTADECAAALADELPRFGSATGLKPFVSYCLRELGSSRTPYFARIDALGAARRYPYRWETPLNGAVTGDSSALLASIVASAKARGIDAYQAALVDDGGNASRLAVRFYDSPLNAAFRSRYFVRGETEGGYDGVTSYASPGALAACQSQLAEAKRGFDAAFSTPAHWFCTWDALLFQARLHLVRVKPTAFFDAETVPFRYPTFAECDADRAELFTLYRDSLGKPPIALLCDWSSGFSTGKPEAYVIRALLPKVP